MGSRVWICVAAAAFFVAGCGAGGGDASEGSGAVANAAQAEANAAAEAPALARCPFRETSDWAASREGGRVLVTGQVDLQMAGFRPTLTERSSGGGTLALDLALVPEPNAAVTERVRYESGGGGGLRRVEIWCGNERIETVDTVVIE